MILNTCPRELQGFVEDTAIVRYRAKRASRKSLILLALGHPPYGSDLLEEVHELMANAFLVVVLLHIGGLVAHALRHHDRLAVSMVTGRKQVLSPEQPAARSRPFAGLMFVVLTAISAAYLLEHYDAQARTLDLFGRTLQLGGGERSQETGGANENRHEAENELE